MRTLRVLTAAVALVALPTVRAEARAFSVSPEAAFRGAFGVAVDPQLIDWKILNSLDLGTGKAPATLAALDGKLVKIAAFIVPLEDNMQEADEFLLVPYFGACVHTPPPPPNQMVYVKMKGQKTVKIGWWDPVMFEGVIRLKQTDSAYGASYYEMEGISSTPYAPPKK
ncbi:MAG: DUF3299 domain-containing protein [Gemmatimonadota bacterium]